MYKAIDDVMNVQKLKATKLINQIYYVCANTIQN